MFILLVASGMRLDGTQVNLFILTVRDFNGVGGKYVTITLGPCGVAIIT